MNERQWGKNICCCCLRDTLIYLDWLKVVSTKRHLKMALKFTFFVIFRAKQHSNALNNFQTLTMNQCWIVYKLKMWDEKMENCFLNLFWFVDYTIPNVVQRELTTIAVIICLYHIFLSLYPQTLIQTCLMSAESAFNTSNFEMHHQSFEDLMIYFVCLDTQFLKDTFSRNCNSTLFQWKISEDIFYKVIRTYREKEPIFHLNFQLYQM